MPESESSMIVETEHYSGPENWKDSYLDGAMLSADSTPINSIRLMDLDGVPSLWYAHQLENKIWHHTCIAVYNDMKYIFTHRGLSEGDSVILLSALKHFGFLFHRSKSFDEEFTTIDLFKRNLYTSFEQMDTVKFNQMICDHSTMLSLVDNSLRDSVIRQEFLDRLNRDMGNSLNRNS